MWNYRVWFWCDGVSRPCGQEQKMIHVTCEMAQHACVSLKRFPPDLNRRDSHGVMDERIFGH